MFDDSSSSQYDSSSRPLLFGWTQRNLDSMDDSMSSDHDADSTSTQAAMMGPLNEPILRESGTSEDLSYFDAIITAPSNSDLQKMWASLVVVVSIIAIFTLSVLIPILASKKTRKSPFNLYLIYLMLPDFGVSFFCSISCLYNVIMGGYPTNVAWPCYLQSFYLVFAISSNAWLNAVVARQLLILLRSSQNFGKYQPPTRTQVTKEALGVYFLCGIIAFMGIMHAVGLSWDSKWPQWTRLAYGAVCFPQPHDEASLVFYFLVFFPLLFLIPLLYVVYASVTIMRQGLLPPSGRRRALAVYFFRLAVAFLVMWAPCLLFFCITGPFVSTGVYWTGAIWGHLQALVSGVMSLMKPDVWKTYKEFYTRRIWSCKGDEGQTSGGSLRYGMSTAFFRSIRMPPLKDELDPFEEGNATTGNTTRDPSSGKSSAFCVPDVDQPCPGNEADSCASFAEESLMAMEEGILESPSATRTAVSTLPEESGTLETPEQPPETSQQIPSVDSAVGEEVSGDDRSISDGSNGEEPKEETDAMGSHV